MDVLARCRAYDKDMARLRLRLACARDAVTRITRSADTTGHGGAEDKMGEYAGRADAIEREMTERRALYAQDLETAARLVASLEPAQGRVMHMRMVRMMTERETAAALRISTDSVRGLYRRGRKALEGMKV